ncbi:MAG: rhomboid family intramembrane serine protease [Ardenticatenaceae bacterium]|nr:rhomboid family intramembrane serine protease [Anaerolineales bacterium]MCB8937477.1 rhomboid family intramembrane serine protease [Ardenticatenaceae bacterium]MCB8975542.1 rhomboid family intramembrane serine protease [Ardenticatenaceae bacterium]
MIPLSNLQPNRYTSLPIMTLTLIVVNMLALILQFLLLEFNRDGYFQLIFLFGSVPTFVMSQQGAGALASITSTFLHGGLLHLASNMLILWAFAQRVEDACGPWRFLAFYLFCGVVADIISTMSRSTEAIPGIGASGAVYGIMAAYLILYPKGRIQMLIFYGFGFWRVPFRAYWVILFYFLTEIPNALGVLLIDDVQSSVAHWAHLGGFFAGTLIFLFLRPDAFHRFRNELPL